MKKTILIFGVSSFLGSNLVEVLKDDFRVIGTFYKTPTQIPGINCLPCDILKKDNVINLVARFRPDIIFYAVGMSSIRKSQHSPRISESLNSVGAINCATASDRYGSQFIYFSSSFIFKSSDNCYTESEVPFSDSVYGKSLSSTEFFLQRSCMNYLILRCCPLYGRTFNPTRLNWFDSLQMKLAKGESILVDDLVLTGFVDIHVVVSIIKKLILTGVTNRLFHISSTNFMTRYEFAKSYSKIFKRDENLVIKSVGVFSKTDSTEEERVLMKFKLDTRNIQDFLNMQMMDIEESLRYTHKRFTSS